MKLSEIFEHLTVGELSQVFLGGAYGEGITAENRHNIISHINLGLTDLHRRFDLKEGRTDVYLVPGLNDYTVEVEDLLKIERVLDADEEDLPLNQEGKPESVLTTSTRALRIPSRTLDSLFARETRRLTVIYRADHPTISKRDAQKEPEKVEVELPQTHLWPLLLFVASRALNPVGMQSDFHQGNNYAAKYEQACRELEAGGYQRRQEAEKTRFEANGWV